ncbi:MAG: S24 family peptidase, partial [Proteobacteria bacterium]|nr:S24 family peptidase [Pseudomonadota bacterium]
MAQEMYWTDGPIDQVPRPHYLAHVKDAYAVYVVGDSMAPMYRPRQLLFVNPYKPPVSGSGVVITLADGAVLIKEFVRQKPTGMVVREYR